MTVRELLLKGNSCSQVMVMMTMELLGLEDPNLVSAMKGLSVGMGIGHACGIVTGAACAFSLADPERGISTLFPAFYEKFYAAYGDAAGGVNCTELLNGDALNQKHVCPDMIEKSWEMAREVLEASGL